MLLAPRTASPRFTLSVSIMNMLRVQMVVDSIHYAGELKASMKRTG